MKIMNYKKIFPVLLLLLCANLFALQAQINRTTQTIIADVLAQMPAGNQADYTKQLGDLASTGEEGVLALAKMLKAPGQGSNASVEYALSGLANYVSGLKDASVKQTAVNAFQKALDAASAPETKAFLQDCLRTLGIGYQPVASASNALPKVNKNSPVHLRIAALQADILKTVNNKEKYDILFIGTMMLPVEKDKEKELTAKVLSALKDPSIEYRNAALNFASPFAGKDTYVGLAKALRKAKPEVKTDLLNWFGRESKLPAKSDLIKNLEIRFDLPLRQVLYDELKNKDPEVRKAAAWALVKIGDSTSIPVLASLLTEKDNPTIKLGKETLASFKGDVAPAVARIISQATDAGKIAAVELLAQRKASAHINTILELTKSGSPDVKKAAYTALKDVVAEKDFTLICGMLETADETTIAPLQQAVITAVSFMDAKEKVATVTRRMLVAGESKKYLYYIVLASIGDDSVPTLVSGFKQGTGAAREEAFNALLAWKDASVADELFAICKDASAPTYFDRALAAYVKLVSNPSITGENRLLSLRKAMEIARTNDQKKAILRQIRNAGTYLSLLYAGEFLDNKALQQEAASAVKDIALNHEEYTGANVKELLTKAAAVLDNPDAAYERQSIKTHLDKIPDEAGFVSIFNGKDLTGWKGLVENPIIRAKMKPDQLAKAQIKADEQMRKDWKVTSDGLLMFDGSGFDNLCTVKQYGDFEMYVDWLLDPSGKEADAGIYLRGTPQVQIWDTARVKAGAQVGSGGLYNNQINPSKPLKVADNKLGEWNTLYIKMIGDRVTVYLNGELVTDNVILENYWDRKQPIFPVEQLELQAHGSKVYYRNIYVKELKRPEPFTLSAEEKKEGYKILFDGTNMFEWTGNTADYTLKEDGTITLMPSHGSGGNLYTKDEYANFSFRFDFLLTPAANNGVGIRTPLEGDAAYVGMEIQILDYEDPVYANITPYQVHGSVYGIIPAKKGFLKPLGEWNTEEILAEGDHIKVTLNGNVIVDGNIREATKNGTPDHQEHPGLFNKTGHIGFLGHGSEVKFRNIRIKVLK
ncbi:hypothetical protein AGMMS49574_00210 [Bacteroidia bacterium]|nr:hypothetical protein AGMMS49574_00210 [Bacteroidia bacterium]